MFCALKRASSLVITPFDSSSCRHWSSSHALLDAGLNRGVHLRHLVLTDQVADRGNADHDFMHRDPPAAILLQQRLGNDRTQRFGQHGAHHRLFPGREHVNDAVDGLGRRTGVQGAEHQMPGFGSGQRQADGLQVAHFADQDNVRVFAQAPSAAPH